MPNLNYDFSKLISVNLFEVVYDRFIAKRTSELPLKDDTSNNHMIQQTFSARAKMVFVD